MAELFMECEEEELEPWQQKVEEVQNKDDDDELIFVGEISSSKPAISNILNRCSPGSSSKGLKNDSLNPAISNIFKPANRHYRNPSPNPVAALPRFHPESKSSESSGVQTVSKPSFSKTSSQDDPGASSLLQLDSTKDTPSSSILKKRTEVNSVNPKKPKTNTSVSEASPSSSSSSSNSPSEASSQVIVANENTSSIQSETGAPSLRSCPKCSVKFSFLDPLKCHMKNCCPDMINNFLETLKSEHSRAENKANIDADKEKLIMLVSDFYYGRHEGAIEEDPKTHTTFKCFSCSKVLKNNIRFMNHMKHHLEHEKQNSESWENHTTCQHCYRQYPNPFQLQCHIESTHTPHDFSTICKICELSFETEHMLLQHMKDTHKPGEMPYICQVCQFRSSIFSDVETHFRSSHENTKNLLCPFCLKVSRMATPYMNHYMKHQNKGIHRCPKCRLQFLTCKEKTDHKLEHRTFIKPKELEGLPPGTKVTIRASFGSVQSRSSSPPSSPIPSTSLQVSSPTSKSTTTKSTTAKSTTAKSTTAKSTTTKSTTTKNNTKLSANKSKISKAQTVLSTTISKPNTSKSGTGATKSKAKPSYKQKKQRTRKNKFSIALKNLRCHHGIHTCMECHSKIKDFSSHFSTHINCDFCKYTTNCNKAFTNHMSSHSDHPSKQFYIFKKHSRAIRGITLVCLKCDFLADTSGLDRMAKHLNQRKTHSCQVVIENVTERTSESTSESRCNTEISKNVQCTPGQCPPSMDTTDACSLFPRNVNCLTVRPVSICGLGNLSVLRHSPFLPDWPYIRLMLIWPSVTSRANKLSTTSLWELWFLSLGL
ncbi:zinc finger protein 280C isoform X2 [Peromyscus maniculatus bairdii]|uniref:zinc finger protein 280C isoform X2 n=1 Tax=Peromyscus maniculatus bairdii TaxID=230844 RepID=UPI001C2E203A|nr:zinc finger protein 280C isoform X2 [Peromyscus maniculatus bairdii]